MKVHVHSKEDTWRMGRHCPQSILLFSFPPLGLGLLGPNRPQSPQHSLKELPRQGPAATGSCEQSASWVAWTQGIPSWEGTK